VPSDAPAEVAVEDTEANEPKNVLLWRPGGRNEGQQNARHKGGRPASEERRDGRRPGASADGKNRGNGAKRGDRQDRGDRKERPQRAERDGKPQTARFEAKPPRKEKPIDPDSPFAKLAALKEQMKK